LVFDSYFPAASVLWFISVDSTFTIFINNFQKLTLMKKLLIAILAVLALGMNSVDAFAWHSTLTTTLSSTTVIIGNGIYDTATLTVSNGGNTQPSGYIIFSIYSGSCSNGKPTGALIATLPQVKVTHAGSYQSAVWNTAGQQAGNYVFVVKYTGGNGYPSATAACEPFMLVNGSSVPEFPLGSIGFGMLFAIALPMLMLIRKRSLLSN
jgi:hypothetical protein